jgi:hypothetical protein
VRAALPILTVVALLVLGAGESATPRSAVVVQGARSGAHLRLAVEGPQLLINGRLARAQHLGCQRHAPNRASCRLSEVGSIVIEMGDRDDKIEVLDPLPVPLVAYLGGGSDKLIGNDEADVCYPQGTARNRCIGNGGDDICVSGPRNTDCVGGPGDDYCRTRGGSDGCWGGPGRDVCVMGGGHDGCHGEGGNDRLYGGPASDRLYGGRGFDYCDGGPGWGKSQGCEAGPRR